MSQIAIYFAAGKSIDALILVGTFIDYGSNNRLKKPRSLSNFRRTFGLKYSQKQTQE